MELAILANVVAYYYSNMGDPVTASKVYALASCFLYDKRETRLTALRNLLSCYKKLGYTKKAILLSAEIKRIREGLDKNSVNKSKVEEGCLIIDSREMTT